MNQSLVKFFFYPLAAINVALTAVVGVGVAGMLLIMLVTMLQIGRGYLAGQ
jgi:hypothetical protein